MSLPKEVGLSSLLARFRVLHVDLPELFRDEFLDRLVSFNDEPKSGELTRAVADDSLPLDSITE